MREMWSRCFVSLAIALGLALPGAFELHAAAQRITRPDAAEPAHPFSTPPAASAPATDQQFSRWREQAGAALFLPKNMPAVRARDFGSFGPMPGVVAHRVTYGT